MNANNNKHLQENNKPKVLRLIYPQWQGGDIDSWIPDIPVNDVSRGYYLGSQLLRFLAPDSKQKTIEVPVSLDLEDRKAENGIKSYPAILKQTKDALALLEDNNMDKIVTLGGECSVSVVPFTYLANKYPNDVAIVWIDAHPDINLPGDGYEGYHAMALAACLGIGDKEIIKSLPAKYTTDKALLVGLRSWDKGMKERQKEWKIKGLFPEDVADNSQQILDWIKQTGASKVVIHFDMDVLDPADMLAAVSDEGGLRLDQAVRIINDVANNYDLISLTVAEPMPRIAIKIKNMLNSFPLLQ